MASDPPAAARIVALEVLTDPAPGSRVFALAGALYNIFFAHGQRGSDVAMIGGALENRRLATGLAPRRVYTPSAESAAPLPEAFTLRTGSQYTEARGAEYANLLPDFNRSFLGCIDAKFNDSGAIF